MSHRQRSANWKTEMCFGGAAQQQSGGGSLGPFTPTGWQPNYGFGGGNNSYGLGNLASWFAPPMSSSFGAPTPQAPAPAPASSTPPAPQAAPQPATSPAPSQSSTPPWMSQLPPQLQSMVTSGSADFPSMMNSLMQWWQTQGQGAGGVQAAPQGAAPSAPTAPSSPVTGTAVPLPSAPPPPLSSPVPIPAMAAAGLGSPSTVNLLAKSNAQPWG